MPDLFQYREASLYNQLLPEFSSNQFETSHRWYSHIEEEKMLFFFDKITAFSTKLILGLGFNIGLQVL